MLIRRQLDMLLYLSNHVGALSGSQLAELYNVTVRTMRSDIKKINDFLNTYGIKVETSNQFGYRINEQDMAKLHRLNVFHTIKSDSYFDIPQTQNERISYLFFLLCGDVAYQIEELAELVFISTASIYHDLQIVKRFLEKRFQGLVLQSVNGKYKLQGEESAKRNLLSGIVSQRYDRFLEKKYSDYISANGTFLDILYQVIKVLSVEKTKFSFTLTGEGLYSFASDVALCVEREKIGLNLEHPPIAFTFAFQKVKQCLCEYIPILQQINEQNWCYLQERFYAKSFLASPMELGFDAHQLILTTFREAMQSQYQVSILEDSKSVEYTIGFLNFMFYNIAHQYDWTADDKYEIMMEYKGCYLIALYFSYCVYTITSYHLSPSYLAKFSLLLEESFLRNEVICRAILISNKDKEHMLCMLHRLIRFFGNKMELMKYVTSYDITYQNIDLNNYDLIISTEMLEGLNVGEYIKIASIITTKDLQKISEYLELKKKEKEVLISTQIIPVHESYQSIKYFLLSFMKQQGTIEMIDENIWDHWELEDLCFIQRTHDCLLIVSPFMYVKKSISYQFLFDQPFEYKKREYMSLTLVLNSKTDMKFSMLKF